MISRLTPIICINHSRIEVEGSLAQNKVKSETHIFTAKDTEDSKKSHFSVFLVEDKTLPFFLEISPNQEGVRDWAAASEKCLINILKVFIALSNKTCSEQINQGKILRVLQ